MAIVAGKRLASRAAPADIGSSEQLSPSRTRLACGQIRVRQSRGADMSEPPTPPAHFSDHQIGIYLQGMFADTKPSITTNLAELEQRAAESLSAEAVGYIVASAGSGATARANRAAFDAWHIVPNMLRDVAARDLSCTVLGTRMPAPVMLAPVGVQTLAHPDGELASARAAAALGLPYIHSTQAAHDFEQVAEANGDGAR